MLVSYAQAWFTEVTGHDDELMGLLNLVEDDRLGVKICPCLIGLGSRSGLGMVNGLDSGLSK